MILWQLKEYEGKETAQLVDRYKFLDLYPCTSTELKSIGYAEVKLQSLFFHLLTNLTNFAQLYRTSASFWIRWALMLPLPAVQIVTTITMSRRQMARRHSPCHGQTSHRWYHSSRDLALIQVHIHWPVASFHSRQRWLRSVPHCLRRIVFGVPLSVWSCSSTSLCDSICRNVSVKKCSWPDI